MEQKLTPHISYLLYRHDCVIVPGFGGFVANYQGAKIHPTQHTFSPPCKNIAFNRSLQNNDGLLANRIAAAENISYPEANQAIAREIESWNRTLDNAKKLSLDRIGVLSFDVEKNLRFEPDTKVNYLLDAFGLSEVQSPPVKREGALDKIAADTSGRNKTTQKAKVRRLSPGLWKVAAAVLILISLGGLTWLSYENGYLPSNTKQLAMLNPFSDSSWMHPREAVNKPVLKEAHTEDESTSTTPVEVLQEVVSVDSLPKVETSAAENTTSPAAENTVSPVVANPEPALAIETPAAQPSTGFTPATSDLRAYLVVAGCFAIKANAENLVAKLRGKGYEASIAGTNNKGLTMVIYKDFDRRKEAVVLLHEVKTKEDTSAWIFRY